MPNHLIRLTVIGDKVYVGRFERSGWLRTFGGRYYDPLELAPGRYACQFETTGPPLTALRKLSRRHPGLVFLLDYEAGRTKGLALAKAGSLEDHRVTY